MQTIRLTVLLALLSTGLFAQEGFKVGVQAGLPLGDFNDKIGVVLGADLGYMWAPNKIFDLGLKTGIIHGFGEQFKEEVIPPYLPAYSLLQ